MGAIANTRKAGSPMPKIPPTVFRRIAREVETKLMADLDRSFKGIVEQGMAALLHGPKSLAARINGAESAAGVPQPAISLAPRRGIALARSKVNVAIFGGALTDDPLAIAFELARQPGVAPIFVLENPLEQGSPGAIKRGVKLKDGMLIEPGRAVIGNFSAPAPVNYAITSFLPPQYYSPEGEDLFSKAGIPTSGDAFMRGFIAQKDLVSGLLGRAGVTMPEWTALAISPSLYHRRLDGWQENIRLLPGLDDGLIRQSLREFVDKIQAPGIVIKPATGNRGRDVSFFDFSLDGAGDREALWLEAANSAKAILSQGENVVVQRRVQAPPLLIDGVKYDSNLRVFVSRDEDDAPVYSGAFVRYDRHDRPVNLSLTAQPMLLDNYYRRLGVEGKKRAQVQAQIAAQAERIFTVLHDRVNLLSPLAHRMDLMGIDIILENTGGGYVPQVIEVNCDMAGGMWDMDNISSLEEQGAGIRAFCRTIARRAREHALN